MRRAFGRASCLILLVLVGCHKLNYEKSESLSPGETKTYTVEAPKGDQKVRVVARSSEGPVSVYLVLQHEAQAVEAAITGGHTPPKDKVLAGAEKQNEVTLDATVPAKNEFTVIVGGASKKTTITVKVTEM